MTNLASRRRNRTDTENKIYKPITAVIRIIDPKTDKITAIHIKVIDDAERRKWVTETVMWAMLNGMIAEVINKDDDEDGE